MKVVDRNAFSTQIVPQLGLVSKTNAKTLALELAARTLTAKLLTTCPCAHAGRDTPETRSFSVTSSLQL